MKTASRDIEPRASAVAIALPFVAIGMAWIIFVAASGLGSIGPLGVAPVQALAVPFVLAIPGAAGRVGPLLGRIDRGRAVIGLVAVVAGGPACWLLVAGVADRCRANGQLLPIPQFVMTFVTAILPIVVASLAAEREWLQGLPSGSRTLRAFGIGGFILGILGWMWIGTVVGNVGGLAGLCTVPA